MNDDIMSIEFTYPVEELDRLLEQIQQGIKPFGMNERLKLELELRQKQLQYLASDYEDEVEDGDGPSLTELHDRMKAEIEKAKRKATTTKAVFRALSKAQREQLESDMMTSIVRKNPGSPYNKTDEELYQDSEQQSIMQKLSRIRNRYNDPIAWANAIKIIREAIDYSLHHDYPLGYEWAVREFNLGRIKYQFGPVPKLYTGFGTKQITDPEILSGIAAGDIKVIKRDEEKATFKREKRKRGNPINCPYSVVSDAEYVESVKLHNRGFDTPISLALKAKAGLFDRLAMPFQSQQQQKVPMLWDWTQEGAGERYYNAVNGINVDHVAELVREIQKTNNGELNQSMMTDIRGFLDAINHPNMMPQSYSAGVIRPPEPSKEAQRIEANIMAQIRKSNLTIL